MRPHPRIRTTIKWCGLALAVVLVAAWVVTIWKNATYYSGDGGFLALRQGSVVSMTPILPYPESPGFKWGVRPSSMPMRWWPRWIVSSPISVVIVPLWIPIVLVSAATAAAWRLDVLARRRARTDACRACGYTLAGLTPGAPCPECGGARVGP